MFYIIIFWFYYSFVPRGLKRESAAARLLGLRLRRADHSSRGVLLIIVCLNVIEKTQQGGGPGPVGAVEQREEKN